MSFDRNVQALKLICYSIKQIQYSEWLEVILPYSANGASKDGLRMTWGLAMPCAMCHVGPLYMGR